MNSSTAQPPDPATPPLLRHRGAPQRNEGQDPEDGRGVPTRWSLRNPRMIQAADGWHERMPATPGAGTADRSVAPQGPGNDIRRLLGVLRGSTEGFLGDAAWSSGGSRDGPASTGPGCAPPADDALTLLPGQANSEKVLIRPPELNKVTGSKAPRLKVQSAGGREGEMAAEGVVVEA